MKYQQYRTKPNTNTTKIVKISEKYIKINDTYFLQATKLVQFGLNLKIASSVFDKL